MEMEDIQDGKGDLRLEEEMNMDRSSDRTTSGDRISEDMTVNEQERTSVELVSVRSFFGAMRSLSSRHNYPLRFFAFFNVSDEKHRTVNEEERTSVELVSVRSFFGAMRSLSSRHNYPLRFFAFFNVSDEKHRFYLIDTKLEDRRENDSWNTLAVHII
uniref:Autophagy-related protein 101 n=1 Tax=Ascaris lumbricoides TaxID=6252 RepID=A0A0M3IJ80_ASCLU